MVIVIGSTRFDLLPMASGQMTANHIFLRIRAFCGVLDSLAQSFKEFGVIYTQRLLLFLARNTREISASVLVGLIAFARSYISTGVPPKGCIQPE